VQSFKRFSLTESNIIQNHISKVEQILSKNGIEYNTYNGTVSIPLPDSAKSIDSKMKKIIDQCTKVAEGRMLLVKTNTGYSTGNGINFIFPSKAVRAKKAYHIANKKYVDDILKNGLKPMAAQDHSNEFRPSLGNATNEQVYKAVFLVKSKGAINKVINMFNIKDPVVLEVDLSGMEVYEDPLMPDFAKSIVTFDTVKKIKISE
jgi:hypothetical protein